MRMDFQGVDEYIDLIKDYDTREALYVLLEKLRDKFEEIEAE